VYARFQNKRPFGDYIAVLVIDFHLKGVTVRRILRDWVHLVRPAVVLLAVLGIFLIVRGAVIPKAFGQFGHYRPGALALARSRPIAYAGQATCVLCHEDQAKVRAAGRHARVACETCHGPQSRHANDPSAVKPPLPDVAGLCRRCHEKDAAKPAAFPQVITKEHSGGMLCNTCHQPHNPHP
jgi:cytochrome c553